MNTLQNELNKINEKLEHLHYRKLQLESIITEYNDVVNRAKNLIDLMMDNDVCPENLLHEIEGFIFNPQPEPEELEETEQPQNEPAATEPEPDFKVENIDLSRDGRSIFLDVRFGKASMRIFNFPSEVAAANCGEELKRQGLTSDAEVYCITNDDWLLVLADVKRIDAEVITQMVLGQPAAVEPTPEAIATQPEHPILWGIAQAQAEKQAEATPQSLDLAQLEQLNPRAWRDEDGWLYLGFTSESIQKAWRRHFDKMPDIETYGESLDEFPYAFRVINHGHVASFWQQMRNTDFSKHPNKQPLKPTPEPLPNFDYSDPDEYGYVKVSLDGHWIGTLQLIPSGFWVLDGGDRTFTQKEDAVKRLWELHQQQRHSDLGCKNLESLTA